MKDIYLVSYSVSGIKTIDRLVTLSFYKKIISPEPDTSDYNVKGIYGINGSGKSGTEEAGCDDQQKDREIIYQGGVYFRIWKRALAFPI